jgi:hypothetical protein
LLEKVTEKITKLTEIALDKWYQEEENRLKEDKDYNIIITNK